MFVFLCKYLQLVQEIRLRFVIVNWFKAPVAVFAEVSKVVFLLERQCCLVLSLSVPHL